MRFSFLRFVRPSTQLFLNIFLECFQLHILIFDIIVRNTVSLDYPNFCTQSVLKRNNWMSEGNILKSNKADLTFPQELIFPTILT